jgi:polyisoprenoid-binding protein YceI
MLTRNTISNPFVRTLALPLIAFALALSACTPSVTDSPASPRLQATLPAPTALPSNPVPTEETSPTSASQPGARTFRLVPEASQASYTVDEEFFSGAVSQLGKQLGLFTPVGVTNAMEGYITLAPTETGTPVLVGGQFTVTIRSLTSDDRRRDERIRESFLESDKYPLATFTPTAINGFPASYEAGQSATFTLAGDLTIRETTRPVNFDVTASLTGDVLTAQATTTILMTDFGFNPPEIAGFMKVENDVLITIDLTAKESGS